jgi:hypothetical protein
MKPLVALSKPIKNSRPKFLLHGTRVILLCRKYSRGTTQIVITRHNAALQHASTGHDHSFTVQLQHGNRPPVLLASHEETFFRQPLTTRFQGDDILPNLHQLSDRYRSPSLYYFRSARVKHIFLFF